MPVQADARYRRTDERIRLRRLEWKRLLYELVRLAVSRNIEACRESKPVHLHRRVAIQRAFLNVGVSIRWILDPHRQSIPTSRAAPRVDRVDLGDVAGERRSENLRLVDAAVARHEETREHEHGDATHDRSVPSAERRSKGRPRAWFAWLWSVSIH